MEGVVKKKEGYFPSTSNSNPAKVASNGYSSNSKLDLGKKKIQLKTYAKKVNNTEDAEVPASSGVDIDSARGRFGWGQVMETHLPYIFRGEDQFFCYRILEQKVLTKLYFHFYKELVACTNPEFVKITEVEAVLFNEINSEHSNFAYGKEKFTTEDVLIKTDYVGTLCGFLHSVYKKMENPNDAGLSKRCGFISISKDAAVPYAIWRKQKYLPVFYFEGETSDLESQSLRLEGLPLAFLKFCCRIQGIRKDLIDKQWCKVIALKDLTNFLAPNTQFKDFWPARTDICRSLRKVDHKKVYTLESIFNMKLNILCGEGNQQNSKGKTSAVAASKNPSFPAKRAATSNLPKISKLPALLPRYRVITETIPSGQNMVLNRVDMLTGQKVMVQCQEKQHPGQNFKMQGQEKQLPGQNVLLSCGKQPSGQNMLQSCDKRTGQNIKHNRDNQPTGQNMPLSREQQFTGQNMQHNRDNQSTSGQNMPLSRNKQFTGHTMQHIRDNPPTTGQNKLQSRNKQFTGQNMQHNRDNQPTTGYNMLQSYDKQLTGQNMQHTRDNLATTGQSILLRSDNQPTTGQSILLRSENMQNMPQNRDNHPTTGQNMLQSCDKQYASQNMQHNRDNQLTGQNMSLDHDKQINTTYAAYKIHYVVIEDKPIACINKMLNDFSEKLVTIIDLSDDFFYNIPVNVCEAIFRLLNIEIYKANDAQLRLLKATGKYGSCSDISLVNVDKVTMYLTQLTYMIRHIIEKNNENNQSNQPT